MVLEQDEDVFIDRLAASLQDDFGAGVFGRQLGLELLRRSRVGACEDEDNVGRIGKLQSPDMNSQLIGKDLDAGKD